MKDSIELTNNANLKAMAASIAKGNFLYPLSSLLNEPLRHEAIRTEAKKMHSMLLDGEEGILEFQRYIETNPPSADVIAFLIVNHEVHLRDERSIILSKQGRKGGEGRSMKTAEIRDWAISQNESLIRGTPTERARKLFQKMPPKFATLSNDPERIIRDAIKTKNKNA